MHAAANNLRGGVSPRGTLLRGQGIIEYVLIIAVIGLVIVFAGPGVAGAIRNQFNLVGNAVTNGTTGGVEGGASGGGTSGGGSAGADSAAVQAAIDKDAEDWSVDEQEVVAEDIAAKGEASLAYAKAKDAMDTGMTWSIKLTNGETMTYRIIGINHDDLADGTGKAGLTFLTTSTVIFDRLNATGTNAGGWEASELRAKMNSGEIWNLMPSEFQSKVKSVTKLTNNVGGGKANKNAAVSETSDKLFLLSNSEIGSTPDWSDWEVGAASSYPWTSFEGSQYEAIGDCLNIGEIWWECSACPFSTDEFLVIDEDGSPSRSYATNPYWILPAWCF